MPIRIAILLSLIALISACKSMDATPPVNTSGRSTSTIPARRSPRARWQPILRSQCQTQIVSSLGNPPCRWQWQDEPDRSPNARPRDSNREPRGVPDADYPRPGSALVKRPNGPGRCEHHVRAAL